MELLKVIKRVINILSIICYMCIIVYALVALPSLFNYKPLIVLSGSMEPTFKVGSIIYYTEVAKEDIAKGDVITFELENKTLVTHRVINIENDKYQTKGDANNSPDAEKIKFEQIKGETTNVTIPYIGYYIKYVNEHLYLVAVVVFILLLEFVTANLKIFDPDDEDESNDNTKESQKEDIKEEKEEKTEEKVEEKVEEKQPEPKEEKLKEKKVQPREPKKNKKSPNLKIQDTQVIELPKEKEN